MCGINAIAHVVYTHVVPHYNKNAINENNLE